MSLRAQRWVCLIVLADTRGLQAPRWLSQLGGVLLNTPSLVSMGAFASLISVSSVAQTLEVYGLAHMSLDRLDNGSEEALNIASNSSRLGVRGEYVFSDSIKLVYQYESGIDLTAEGKNADGNGGANDGNAVFSKTRPSFIGVDTDYGRLVYGHTDWLDQWANEFNMFADQIGDLGNFWAASGLPGRLDDVYYYRSPSDLPAYVTVSYRPKDREHRDAILVKGGASWDNWNLSVTHTELEQGVTSEVAGGGSIEIESHTAQIASLYYRNDVYAIGLGVQRESDAMGMESNDRTSLVLDGSRMLSDRSRFRALLANTRGRGADSNAIMWALGYDHFLSDQLTVYADVGAVYNEANASFSVNSKGHGKGAAPLPGEDPYVASLGFVYNFSQGLFGD